MGADLTKLMEEAQARYDAMSPEEQEAMWRQQRDGYARAEASWPKPKFEWIDGVKIYASFEDYCNG